MKTSYLLFDAGNGDAGKGKTERAYAERFSIDLVLRKGNAGGGHNDYDNHGQHHTFSQISSPAFFGAHTHLTRLMTVDPVALLFEARHLEELGYRGILTRQSIHRLAPVISPFQRSANRVRETARDKNRHGSVGVGVGETMADALNVPTHIIRAGDLLQPDILRKKLEWLQRYKHEQMEGDMATVHDLPLIEQDLRWLTGPSIVERAVEALSQAGKLIRITDDTYLPFLLAQDRDVIFGGSQGVLIDEWHGFAPYHTWTDSTTKGAEAVLKENNFDGQIVRVGIFRAYGVRHGPGPFVSEDTELSSLIVDPHNLNNEWQRDFRIGWFDRVAIAYGIEANGGAEELVITCFDQIANLPEWKICTAYRLPDGDYDRDKFFHLDPNDRSLATGIRLGPEKDLEHQAKLAEILMHCTPVYGLTIRGTFEERVEGFINMIERDLKVRVCLTSFGPYSQDNRWRF